MFNINIMYTFGSLLYSSTMIKRPYSIDIINEDFILMIWQNPCDY